MHMSSSERIQFTRMAIAMGTAFPRPPLPPPPSQRLLQLAMAGGDGF